MNTRARVATVCQANRFFNSVAKNREYVLAQLDLALRHTPDLVCLPETLVTASLGAPAAEMAETVPGPTLDVIATRARAHRCYILCPLLTRRDGNVYNSAVLLDRSGEIAGIYDKRQPVTTAPDYTVLERGVTPGTSDGVFDLDFGRIGVRICFDVGFSEEWEALAREDVRLVVWPSAYNGGQILNAYALLHRFYIVTAVLTDRSRIIDPCGVTRAQTDRLLNVAVQDINLDYAVCHYDFNFGIPDRILTDYAGRVAIHSHLDDGCFQIEPTDPSVTIAGLQQEYGFETMRQYHQRHRDAYAALGRGEAPSAQVAAHGERAMYAK